MFLFLNTKDELLRLDIDKIVYFESDGNYTNVVMINKLKNKVSCNLSQMEKILADKLKERATVFMRIGKRFIVNLNFVYSICIHKQQLVVSDCVNFAYQLPISKEALKMVKDLIVNNQFSE